jgi:tetratricopeptide (TPR) repeat protein
MAPEQAQGGVVDQRSDIYSVGALLYEMVTGSPPQLRNKELVAPRVLRNELADEIDRTIVRALEPDPDQRYQTMTQLEYDIVKGLWGRPRAVNELLGLRVMRRRAETSPQREAVFAASALESITAPIPGMTPASGLYALERAAGRVPAVTPTSDVIAAAAETAPGGRTGGGMSAGRRFAGTFAALALVSVAAVIVYQRTLLVRRPGPFAPAPAPTSPAPAVHPEVEQRAQRVRAESQEIERLLQVGLGFAEVPALEGRLSHLRADGAGAVADALAARAEEALTRAAEGELDRGEIDAGVAHYRLALRLDPRGPSSDTLARTLRARAAAARTAKHGDEAIRWARAQVAVADADAGAHLLLADVLSEASQDDEAVGEYRKALASAPDDPEVTRGLARAEKRLAAGKHRPGHAHRAARSTGRVRGASQPDDGSAAAASGAAPDDADRPAAKPGTKSETRPETKSAPAEPAPDQQ